MATTTPQNISKKSLKILLRKLAELHDQAHTYICFVTRDGSVISKIDLPKPVGTCGLYHSSGTKAMACSLAQITDRDELMKLLYTQLKATGQLLQFILTSLLSLDYKAPDTELRNQLNYMKTFFVEVVSQAIWSGTHLPELVPSFQRLIVSLLEQLEQK